jgi:hypothetical protein
MCILNKVNAPDLETFPKQDAATGEFYGNCINIPFFGEHRPFIDNADQPVTLDYFLENIHVNEEQWLDVALEALLPFLPKPPSAPPLDEKEGKKLKKTDRPCYAKMLLGVPEGYRDEAAFRLACHMYKQGLDQEWAWKTLSDWNKERNMPPLDEESINAKIAQGYSGKYGWGCESPLLNNPTLALCSTSCRLYKAKEERAKRLEKKVEHVIEEDIKTERLADLPQVRPALDFVGTTMFITVPWLIQKKEMRKVKNTEGEVEEKEFITREPATLCITSNREVFPCESDAFFNKNLQMIPMIAPDPRWSYPSREAFLEGKITKQNVHLTYVRITGEYMKYVEYHHPATYSFLALWVIGTYFFPLFKAYPYIYFGGDKESGKTKSLTVTQQMAFNAVQSGNISQSSLYRIVEGQRATLLIDEAEILKRAPKAGVEDRGAELRQLLQASYKPGNPVLRTEKNANEQFTIVKFDAYSPKMLASISGLDDVLESRVIPIRMLKTMDLAKKDLMVKPEDPVFQEIRDELYCIAMTRCQEIKLHYANEVIPPEGVHARNWEMWQPILALARMVAHEAGSPDIYDRMVELARIKTNEKLSNNLDKLAAQLLLCLREKIKYPQEITCAETVQWMKDYLAEEAPKWLTSQWVLARFEHMLLERKGKITSGPGRGRALFHVTPEIIADHCLRADLDDQDLDTAKEEDEDAPNF